MPSHSVYPARLEAKLDSNLNRWLWLVKWFLLIPHYIILIFLWLAFIVTSVVAFFIVLFKGKFSSLSVINSWLFSTAHLRAPLFCERRHANRR